MYKVLIIGPSWLGDMVMAQALFKILYSQNKIIDVLAPKWNHGILKSMPEVNQALEMPFDHGDLKLLARYQFAQKLKKYNYNECIVIPNSFKSALIPFFAKIPVRTGWLGEFRYGVLNNYQKLNKKSFPLMVQRLIGLADLKNINNIHKKNITEFYPKLIPDQLIISAGLEKYNLNSYNYIIMAPGAAFGESKKWPEEYFAKVAVLQIKKGYKIILLGSKKDKNITDNIYNLVNSELNNQDLIKNCLNLAGLLELDETVALISKANIIISNDSGLLHVAASLDTPIIAIYGSTSPDFTPPLITESKKSILAINNLDCRPCFKRTCRYNHYKCLTDIKPEVVNNSIEQLEKSCVS